jgi:hypothetical protein
VTCAKSVGLGSSFEFSKVSKFLALEIDEDFFERAGRVEEYFLGKLLGEEKR